MWVGGRGGGGVFFWGGGVRGWGGPLLLSLPRTTVPFSSPPPLQQPQANAHNKNNNNIPPTPRAYLQAVSQYFARFQPEAVPYGFLPELPQLLTVREEIDAEHATQVCGCMLCSVM